MSSFYGQESDVVRRRFTPQEKEIETKAKIIEEKKLASDKRDLIDFSQVNKVKVVDSTENSGFYCAACNITLKDSSSYLDHVNSRAHGRNLGLEMRVERATFEQVYSRIEMHKKKLKEPKKTSEDVIKEKRKLQEELELEKKLERKQRKSQKSKVTQEPVEAEEDPMFKALGFSNFNSSKK